MDPTLTAAAIGVGGTVIVGIAGFWASVRNTNRTSALTLRAVELTEQGQVTDRYTKAVGQLGDESSPVRVGGGRMVYLTMRDGFGFVRQTEKCSLAAVCAAVVGIVYPCEAPQITARRAAVRRQLQGADTSVGSAPGRVIWALGARGRERLAGDGGRGLADPSTPREDHLPCWRSPGSPSYRPGVRQAQALCGESG